MHSPAGAVRLLSRFACKNSLKQQACSTFDSVVGHTNEEMRPLFHIVNRAVQKKKTPEMPAKRPQALFSLLE
jgi:hypothetical protein